MFISDCLLRQRRYGLWLPVLCTLFLLTSCNSKKYLKEGESFLRDNKIVLKSDDKIDDAPGLKEKLATLYRQRETRGIIPRHVYYYRYQERMRRDSIRRLEAEAKGVVIKARKRWSEERLIRNRPVIHDSVKAQLTTETFEIYLNQRGYRSAEATFRAKTIDKETWVTYLVDPGPRLYIDTFIIATSDSSLRRIVDRGLDESFFKENSPLDIELYNKETARLVDDFQNEGYARLDETYIAPLEVDTAGGYVRATMPIRNENDSILHKKYYVGDITIYPDYNLSDTSMLFDTVIRNITYITPEPDLTLKPEAIERNLFLKEGELTRADNLRQTLKNLSRMELIKFVTQNPVVDTAGLDSIALLTPTIDYTFYFTRNKKIGAGANVEVTYASVSFQTRRSLIGTAASINYRDLNLFKGAEILNLNMNGGVEFNFLNRSETLPPINNINFGLGSNISFPRFMDPLGLYRLMVFSKKEDQPALMGDRLSRWLFFDATSRLNLSYNFINITDLYKYYTINTGLSYDVIPDNFRKLTIERIGIDLFVPTPTDEFIDRVLSQSKFQAESFGKYLISGLLFRSYLYEFKAPPRRKGGYFTIIHGAELSGLEVLGINLAYNAIANNQKEFTLGSEDSNDSISNLIEFSHYAKGEVDIRFYYNFNSNIQFALKFNPGVASPFGKYSQQVPYLKQFFVGGALSNRAWQTRELGPGSYHDLNADNIEFAFYQTGDIKLDMSAELRFPLIWYFDGAAFIDAANVWTIRKDTSRTDPLDPDIGTHFQLKDFLSELGIGYGFGIRMDLDYFIIRADWGFKWHSPYDLEDGTRYYKPNLVKDGELQIAVGMPF
jgi:hypothetical protein